MARGSVLSAALAAILAAAPTAAQSPPPDVDHYLCYRAVLASGSPAFTPLPRTLLDQLPPAITYDLRRVVTLCNPADKNAEGTVHPHVHQVGYRLRPRRGSPRFVKSTHATLDQLGARSLLLMRAESLLVPSTKVLGTGGAPPYAGGTAVDHYKCYRARSPGPFAAPTPPIVADQLFPGGQLFRLRRPTKLCTPVDKDGEDPSAPDHAGHLVCYRARLPMGTTFPRTVVSTNNQIRAETLELVRPVELCLPALKDPPPTTTSTSTTSTSVTTTSVTSTTVVACTDPTNPAGPPFCWGSCPEEAPICASTASGCACIAGTTPCGSTSLPQCDGVCPPDRACVISLDFGCTCEFQGFPCGLDYPVCSGICSNPEYECIPVSVPDGDGCLCVPPGSTCHQTYPACGGSCPEGQTCTSFVPGLCLCQ
jgi:hypothetical protein